MGAATTRFGVVHETRYRYSRPMIDGYTIAYVLPRPTAQQMVESALVDVVPEADEFHERTDAFGNRVVQIGMHRPHEEVTITARSRVVFEPMVVHNDGPPWETVAVAVDELRGGAALQVRPFAGGRLLTDSPEAAAELAALVARSFTSRRPVIAATRDFCAAIHDGFEFDASFSDVTTPLSEVLAARRGVCQDFAHLAVAGLRQLGLAVRYVSGYIETDPPPGKPKLVGADASHAWCAVWVPGVGWVDFDPTNDRLPIHRHVTVAWGRDYDDVPPVRGVVIGEAAEQELDVRVGVCRLER